MSRKQAQRSRIAIDKFLAERDSPSLGADHRTLLLSCEKRAPELIETCLQRCANAGRDQRDRYIDRHARYSRPPRPGGRTARREVREADDRRLETLHRYFDGVAGDGKRGPARADHRFRSGGIASSTIIDIASSRLIISWRSSLPSRRIATVPSSASRLPTTSSSGTFSACARAPCS